MSARGVTWVVWLGVGALAVAVYATLGQPTWLLAGGPPAPAPARGSNAGRRRSTSAVCPPRSTRGPATSPRAGRER
ncbi:MAG: hypothetical protein ACO3HB_02935, partial [Burkholderiaceae bacterium]